MDKETILNELHPLQGTKKIIVENQSTGDIIEGILDTHKRYQNQYDKIYKYFVGSSLNDTCNNIWQFLKDNVKYYVEPQKLQTLRSPAAILSKAADCKSYSLFANGILDAYRRNENKNFDVCYRFAGYTKPKRIEHVFSVCVDKKGNEIWTDAVLKDFNDRFTIPVYFRDKKINNMALVAMAGVPKNTNWRNQGVSYESVGKVPYVFHGNRIGDAQTNAALTEAIKNVDWNSVFSFFGNLFNYKSDGEKHKDSFDAAGMTVDEIANYYIDNRAKFGRKDDWQLNEFSELYSNRAPEQGHGWTNRNGEIKTSTANNFNAIVNQYVNRYDGAEWQKILIPLNEVNKNVKPPSSYTTGTGTGTGTSTGTGTGNGLGILPIALVALAAKFLIFK